MATICDSCFESSTGILPSASYPHSTTYESPDRIYCVGGLLVAPPSRGTVSPLSGRFSAEPVSSPATSFTLVATTYESISWTNLTARTLTAFAFLDGYLIGNTPSTSTEDVVRTTLTLTRSDGSTATATPAVALPYNSAGNAGSVSFGGNTAALSVAPGQSVTVGFTAAFSAAGATSAFIREFAASFILMGGSA